MYFITAVPDPCINNPCVNGGMCSRVQGTCYAYQCACQPGFEGVNCEIRKHTENYLIS